MDWNPLELLRMALSAVSEPVLVVRVSTGRIVEANPPACQLVGLPRAEVLGGEAAQVLERIDLGHLLKPGIAQAMGDAPLDARRGHEAARCASFEWTVLVSREVDGDGLVLVGRRPPCGAAVHAGPIKPTEEPSRRVDPLTGLPDRTEFERHLARNCVADVAEPQAHFAVLFLDLDGFKAVNDQFGHRHGDRLLRGLAQRLLQAVRPGDLVARFGGDEFTVLLEGVHAVADAVRVAQRLLAVTGTAAPAERDSPAVSMSVGIALGRPGMAPDAVVDAADRAMYRAKAAGGGGWAVAEDHGPA